MKEITQHYFVEVNEPDVLEIGQPIVDDNDVIIGFVYGAFNGRAEVMLWEPMELEFENHMENIAGSVEEIYESFAVAMVKSSEFIRENWKQSLRQ